MSDGVQIDFFIEGKGFPILVVTEAELVSHAMSSSLKDRFKFIFINGRMNMPDPGDVAQITFDLLTKDVEAVRKSLNLEKVGVFGHSISGLIALEYARRYPQHTAFVVMNGTPPYDNPLPYRQVDKHWAETASAERKRAFTERWKDVSRDSLKNLGTSEAGKRLYILDGPQCWYDYRFDATPLLAASYWNMAVWNQIFQVLMANYDLDQGRPVRSPVFLSLGKHDYYIPLGIWDDFKIKIPNLTIKLFEKSGHYPYFEEEELFRKEISEWVENLKIIQQKK